MACHSVDFYGTWLIQLRRCVDFPKLVVTGDAWTDPSLEGIIDIEVVDLRTKTSSEKYQRSFLRSSS